jgi:adenine-specific DNA-methyltransferase
VVQDRYRTGTEQTGRDERDKRRNTKRRELFDAQDAIHRQREDLIGKIEKQLKHSSETQTLFTIRWHIN